MMAGWNLHSLRWCISEYHLLGWKEWVTVRESYYLHVLLVLLPGSNWLAIVIQEAGLDGPYLV